MKVPAVSWPGAVVLPLSYPDGGGGGKKKKKIGGGGGGVSGI